MTLRLRLALTATIAFVLVTLAPALASAHAELVRTEPVSAAVAEAAPARVVLTFTEGVDVRSDGIKVLRADGRRLASGKAGHRRGTRSVVEASLPRLADGTYVVSWRVTSADSHPISGAFPFSVGDAPPAATTAPTLASPSGSALTGAAFAALRFVLFASFLAVVGAAAASLTIDGSLRLGSAPVVRWTATVALAVLAIASALSIAVQGAYSAGRGLGAAVDPAIVTDVVATRFGLAALARIGLCVLGLAFVRPRWPAAVAPMAAVAVGLAATIAAAGHASTGALVPPALAADAVHILAGGLWVGGLATYVILARRRAHSVPSLRRFSRLAAWCVVTVVVTGTAAALRQLDSVGDLTGSAYGRLLLAKVAGVALLLAVAIASRRYTRRGPDALRRLNRTVRAEVVAGIAIVALTAGLVNAAPPSRASAPARSAAPSPFVESRHLEDVRVEVTLDPARVGANRLDVAVDTHGGAPADVPEVTASLEATDRDLGKIDVPLVERSPGRWGTASPLVVPFAATWRLDVAVRTSDIDLERARFTIPITETP